MFLINWKTIDWHLSLLSKILEPSSYRSFFFFCCWSSNFSSNGWSTWWRSVWRHWREIWMTSFILTFNVLRRLLYSDGFCWFIPSTVRRVIWKKIVCMFVGLCQGQRLKVKCQQETFLKLEAWDVHVQRKGNGVDVVGVGETKKSQGIVGGEGGSDEN